MNEERLKIVELQAENIKRIRAVRIVPSENVVVIGGVNGAGKTSVLDCIEMAMAGGRSIPETPVRRGESKAYISLDLGELLVERTFDSTGTHLTVRNKAGAKMASPQAILDKLYNKISFRPLDFANQEPAKQLATLKRIVGLDFVDLDSKRNKLYERRTEVGRVRDSAEVKVTSYPVSCLAAPNQEVSIAALLEEKGKADDLNQARMRQADATATAYEAVEQAKAALAEAEKKLAIEKERLSSFVPAIDTAPIMARIRGAEETNKAVRDKLARKRAQEDFRKLDEERKTLTEQIEKIDAAKAERMAGAKWPIAGLGFGEDGITYQGLPFEQASAAERLKVSLAIGVALNPALRVLRVEDASLLDKASMALVREVATRENMQIWLERVGDGDEGAIVIEDGAVVDHSGDV